VVGDRDKIEGGTAVKCNVPVAEAINDEAVLPEGVQDVLGQLVGPAKEGLLALSVEVGLGVLREPLEQEVERVVGPKGRWKLGADRGPPRPRERRGDARRLARAGQAAAGQDRGRRVRGAALYLRPLRRP
jgi:hypothetical protein